MRHNDAQLGSPDTLIKDTASALSGFTTEGVIGYATDTHKFGYRDNSTWVFPSTSSGITGTGTDGRAMRWGTNNALDSSLILPTGASILTLSPSATCTLTIVNTASIVGTFSAAGRSLTVQTGDVKLTGAGSTTELSLPNAKITLAGGGTSCNITLPNFAMTFAGAAGKTLTLTNSLTNQGGFDGTISWSAAVTLTVAAASVSGTNTGDVTLATNHGLSLTNQVIGMGTPSTLTSATTNTVTTTTHTHAVTGLFGNGAAQYQYIVTGATPFAPVYSSGYLNITAAKTLTASVSMTLAGADSKTLTLTNSLTNQGGNDGILSWSGAFTLTIPATGTAALLGTANIFTAIQTQKITDAGTTTVVSKVIGHNSSGTPAANFGSGLTFQAHTTTTVDTLIGQVSAFWLVATHASRTAVMTFSVTDFGGTREVIRIGGNGTAGTLGFFGVTAVVRSTAYTQTYATALKTLPAITSLAAPAGGTGTAAGGYDTSTNRNLMITSHNAIRTDLESLYKVVTAMIDDLQAYGLFQ